MVQLQIAEETQTVPIKVGSSKVYCRRVQVKRNASDNAAAWSLWTMSLPAPSRHGMQSEGSGLRRVVCLVREQTSRTHNVPNFLTVNKVAQQKFPKTNLKVAVPHVGNMSGTNVFAKSRVVCLTAAFCQLEERGKKSLMCENDVSIRRGWSRYEDRWQQQRRAGAAEGFWLHPAGENN